MCYYVNGDKPLKTRKTFEGTGDGGFYLGRLCQVYTEARCVSSTAQFPETVCLRHEFVPWRQDSIPSFRPPWLLNQPPTVYTTTNPQGDTENAFVTRVPLPMDVRNAKLLRLKGAYGSQMQVGSGAPSVWKVG